MAKQSVTFVERHVEKIVLGVAGGALLILGVLYLITSPHKIEVGGESLGPQDLYAHIRQQAERARIQMRNKEPDTSDGDAVRVPDLQNQLSPYDDHQLPKEFGVAFVPMHPPVPAAHSVGQRGRIRLAEILPPSPIRATTGRAHASLPSPVQMTSDATREAGVPDEESARDWHWVAVFSAVHRAAQRELFAQADYDTARQQLIVTGVEAERQEWLAEGRWGAPQIVTGYAPRYVPIRRQVDIEQTDLGISTEDLQDLVAYRILLESPQNQDAILRPDFQQLLPFPFDWQVPDLPGVNANLSRYALVAASDPAPTAGGGIRTAAGAAGQPSTNVEPVWLNDLSVEPGKLYRYRLRLLVFNNYAGRTFDLADPQDAGRVVIPGQWSDWSPPIRVEAARQLFVNPPSRRDEGAVRVELRTWSEGGWQVTIERCEVGDPLHFRVGREEIAGDTILGALALERPFRERLYRGGEVSYRDRPTVSAVLISAEGEVKEHLASRDADLRRALTITERERQRMIREHDQRQ